MISLEDLLGRVRDERARQDYKFGRSFDGRDPNVWLAILMEEVGEARLEVGESDDKLVTELVQVAAVALSWAENVDSQGRTGQDPQTALLALDTINLGDRAQKLLDARYGF